MPYRVLIDGNGDFNLRSTGAVRAEITVWLPVVDDPTPANRIPDIGGATIELIGVIVADGGNELEVPIDTDFITSASLGDAGRPLAGVRINAHMSKLLARVTGHTTDFYIWTAP